MKNYLIFIRYKGPMDTVEKNTPDHRAYLKTWYASGTLLFSGPFVPRTAGVLWAQATERSIVDEMIAGDPFQTQGVADYEVVEFNPTLFAPQLEPVFADQAKASGTTK